MGLQPLADWLTRFRTRGYRPTHLDLVWAYRLPFDQTPTFIHDTLLPTRHKLQRARDRGDPEPVDSETELEDAQPNNQINDNSFANVPKDQDYTSQAA